VQAQVAGAIAAQGGPPSLAAAQTLGGNQGAATGALTGARTAQGLFNTNQIVQRLGGIQGNSVAEIQQSASRLFGQRIQGWDEYNVSQMQVTATKAFAPNFGANQWVLVAEVGANYVHNMPNSADLRLDGPGTTVGFNPAFSGQGGMPYALDTGYATKFSWGYRTAVRFDYLNAVSGVNLFPSISWQHDVNGITPGPISNFLEGRKALSFGLRAILMERWTADLNYSTFFGAGVRNQINDRDFVSVSLKYSF